MNVLFDGSAFSLSNPLDFQLECLKVAPLLESSLKIFVNFHFYSINNFLIQYISDVIKTPFKIQLTIVKLEKITENLLGVSVKFPEDFRNKFIEKDRNILNNFGVLQFESLEEISRVMIIFSEENKENDYNIKIILLQNSINLFFITINIYTLYIKRK